MKPAEAPETLILTRADVARLMEHKDWLEAVETGFRAAALGQAESPLPVEIAGAGGAFHAKGASLRAGRHYVALKLNGNFPDNPSQRGLPTIQGAILLCDAQTGSLLAIMDSIEVTLRRTAAASALAARFLARPDSQTVLICGCGEQGAAQLASLRAVLPLRRVLAWDRDPAKARAFEGEAVSDLAAAAAASDVIVTATTSTKAFLSANSVSPGTFIAAVGADSPGKSEIAPELMAKALVVADVLEQCAVMGDLHHALQAGTMRLEEVHAELAELVVGETRGRTDDAQITIFDSTGTALQDVAAAARIYERCLADGGFTSIALGAH